MKTDFDIVTLAFVWFLFGMSSTWLIMQHKNELQTTQQCTRLDGLSTTLTRPDSKVIEIACIGGTLYVVGPKGYGIEVVK